MIALGANVSEKTRGYSTSQATSGYTFSGGEYITVAITGKGTTSRPTTEVMKQYTVAAGSSGGNSLTYQKDANGTSSSGGFDWLSKSETVSIRAWSDGKTTTASTPATDPHNSLFTIEKNQNTKDANDKVQVKELLYSPANDYDYDTYSSSLNIPLYHQLARIVITVTRDDTDHDISAITIGNSTNKVPIAGTFSKPTTGNVGSWAVATIDAQPTHWDVITPKEETANSVYSAVMIPATYAKDLKLINFSVNTRSFAYKLPAAVTFLQGKQYNYNITVKNSSITVTSDITDWTDATPGTDFTHGDGLAVQRTIKMNPLWYVANYNLNNVESFDMTASTSQGYLFNWATAASLRFSANSSGYDGYELPSTPQTVSNGGSNIYWHLPTYMEMCSIFPTGRYGNIWKEYEVDDGTGTKNNIPEGTDGTQLFDEPACTFGFSNSTKYSNGIDNTSNVGISYKSYWSSYTTNDYVRYAIRFIGTPYCSVWRYKGVDWNTTSARLIVSARLIDIIAPSDASVLASTMASLMSQPESFWDDDESSYSVQRVFYISGYKNASTMATAPGTDGGHRGFYWTATVLSEDLTNSWMVHIRDLSGEFNFIHVIPHPKTLMFSVRLFRDN